MRILAVDTSAVCAGVAVTDDGKILSECSTNTGLTHSRTLLPMIDSALRNADIPLESIDLFACSAGPGSFTGIRIGVAGIKGLCDATGKKCIAVSTLEALAYNLIGNECIAVSVMDARCNQVYCGIFLVENHKVTRLTEDEALKIVDLKDILEHYDGRIIFVGDGAELFASLSNEDSFYLTPETIRIQRASGIAIKASSDATLSPVSPDALQVIYLRKSQAEREREEKLK